MGDDGVQLASWNAEDRAVRWEGIDMFFDVCVCVCLCAAWKIALHKLGTSSSLVVFCIVRVRSGCLFGLGKLELCVATEAERFSVIRVLHRV